MSDFQHYFAEMPWVAIPHGDKRKDTLSQRFGVEGIPTFVTIDGATGKTINANARGAISDLTSYPWAPAPVNDLASPEGINDEAALCLMMEGCGADVRKEAQAALTPIAKASLAAGTEMLFFIAHSDEGAVPQVRKLTKLEPATVKPELLLLDIPDQGGFYHEELSVITAEAIESFLSRYKSGALKRQQLG